MSATLRSLGVFCPALAAGMLLANCTVRDSSAAGIADRIVELSCKILSPLPQPHGKFWKLELKAANGQPIRRAVAMNGTKVNFKDLTPGIYVVCISDLGRESCESFDLNPPTNKASFRFTKQVQAPTTSPEQADRFRVSRIRLAVPEKAREEMVEAERAQFRGATDESVDHLRRAISIYPEYVDALNNLGTHYHRAGDLEQAIALFTRVTELDPDFYGGWINLGGCLLAKGEFKPAHEVITRGLNIRPNDPLLMGQYALSCFYLRDYDQAKKYFAKVLKADPAAANSPQLFLAHIAFVQKHTDEAVGYIQNFLEWHPNSPEAPRLRETLRGLTPNSVGDPPVLLMNEK